MYIYIYILELSCRFKATELSGHIAQRSCLALTVRMFCHSIFSSVLSIDIDQALVALIPSFWCVLAVDMRSEVCGFFLCRFGFLLMPDVCLLKFFWLLWGRSGVALGHFWVAPGRSGAALGHSWAPLGRSWAHLGCSWLPLGLSWPLLALSWLLLGCSWPLLGRSWGPLGRSWVSLGRSWAALGRSWPLLGQSRPLLAALGARKSPLKRDCFKQ